MAERRGRCRLPTDLRDHSLSLFLPILFSLLFSLSILVSFPRNPSSRLVTLPVPPVSGFAVHWNARVIIPSFSIDLFRDTAEPTDFLFHCFCPDARAYLSLQLLPRMPFLPSTDHPNTLPLRGFSRFACFGLTFHKRAHVTPKFVIYMYKYRLGLIIYIINLLMYGFLTFVYLVSILCY